MFIKKPVVCTIQHGLLYFGGHCNNDEAAFRKMKAEHGCYIRAAIFQLEIGVINRDQDLNQNESNAHINGVSSKENSLLVCMT